MTFRDQIVRVFSEKGKAGVLEWAQSHFIVQAFHADPESKTIFDRNDFIQWLKDELSRGNFEPFRLFLDAGWKPDSSIFRDSLYTFWETTKRQILQGACNTAQLPPQSHEQLRQAYRLIADSQIGMGEPFQIDIFMLDLDPALTAEAVAKMISPYQIRNLLHSDNARLREPLIEYVLGHPTIMDPLYVLPDKERHRISKEMLCSLARVSANDFRDGLLWLIRNRPDWFEERGR